MSGCSPFIRLMRLDGAGYGAMPMSSQLPSGTQQQQVSAPAMVLGTVGVPRKEMPVGACHLSIPVAMVASMFLGMSTSSW